MHSMKITKYINTHRREANLKTCTHLKISFKIYKFKIICNHRKLIRLLNLCVWV